MNIQDFCAKDNRREYLKKPFNNGNKTIATNGHIMIVLEKFIEQNNKEAEDRTNNIVEKFLSHEFNEFYKLPAIDFEKYRCGKCEGSGVSNWCDECGGNGVVYLENEHNEYRCDCMSCSNRESGFCVNCDGRGFGESHDCIVLHCNGEKKGFNAGYIRLIAMLDNVTVSISKSHKELKFVFDGGLGFLMPMANLDDWRIKIKEEFVLEPATD